ncbi:MAG: ThiF family adenylyltransferase, partial [Bacteroidia bacterium]|nr:ThiF family adenylyltransferase [Bacteroidia bacterium]
DLEKKLNYDFDSLKQWINKYYITAESDQHYEHIIVPSMAVKGIEAYYLFTETAHNFKSGDFGLVEYSWLNLGMHDGKKIDTFIIQSFHINNKKINCNWSNNYTALARLTGLYVFFSCPPVVHKRFAVKKWSDLEPFVNPAFKSFFRQGQARHVRNNQYHHVPLFIGYNLPNGEIHWQCAAIENGTFPVYQKKSAVSRLVEEHFVDGDITWLQTKNCSYDYFFGRGTLSKKLTEAKILIIGVGAIGSNLATTLTRGGCKQIYLADYDIKEPENVCRAEYTFASGLTSKVHDLSGHLCQISPFLDIKSDEQITDLIKLMVNKGTDDEVVKEGLEKYDFIFDCSTDNDLAFILDQLSLRTRIINLSITNHAKELVCVTNPNLYDWLIRTFEKLSTGESDMYNPTGCWSPTFKASYNDIATLVQFTIKHINYLLNNDLALRNFYLQTETATGELNIKTHSF